MSDVVEGPWLKPRPPYLFHYVRLRTEVQLGRLERLLLGDEIYARSLLDLNPVFDVRTMEYNTCHSEPAPCRLMEPRRPRDGLHESHGPTRNGLDDIGVVCLSEHQNSLPVWRNQGDRQRGVCLRFVTTAPAFADATLLPVQYAPNASIPRNVLGAGLAWAAPILLTKPQGWDDEAEWRWLLPGRAGTHIKIDPLLNDGVVFGPLMPDGLRERVLDIVSQRRAPTALCRTKIDPDTMRVAVSPAT